jgi:putative endonuclease
MKHHNYYVCIAASPSRTISTGVTSDLERRMWQHRAFRGFTADHGVTRLVWFAEYRMIDDAIARWNNLARNWYDDRD